MKRPQAYYGQFSTSHWIGRKNPARCSYYSYTIPRHNFEHLIKKDGDTVHISAEALAIRWGKSERFWKWINPSPGESVFPRVAEIIQMQGLDVSGELDLSKYELANKTYEVVFKIKFTDKAFGWDQTYVTVEVTSPDGKKKENIVLLDTFRGKGNGVHEIHAGEFTPNHSKGVLGFGMYEIQTWMGGLIPALGFGMHETKTPRRNGGLILEEVIVRPKYPWDDSLIYSKEIRVCSEWI